MIVSPPPRTGPFVHWVHDGEDRIWADLNARLEHWQGQAWREDKVTVAALAAEARRFNKRYPVGDCHRRAAWWALGGAMAREDCMGALLDSLSVLDGTGHDVAGYDDQPGR